MTLEAGPDVERAGSMGTITRAVEQEPLEWSLRQELLRARTAERELQAQVARLITAQALVDSALDGITLTSLEGRVVYANAAFKTLSGFGEGAVGSTLDQYYDPEEYARLNAEIVPALLERGTWTGLLRIRRPDGTEWMGQTSGFLLRDAAEAPAGMAGFFRDVTAQLESERTQRRLQEELIEAQQRALRALGTPLMPIAKRVIAMPLVGDIDTARAAQIMEVLLEGITGHRARVAILDITGVKVVDTQVADALIRAARAARMLGAEVVLTGASPQVSQTLVGLGVELQGIVTRANLESGIAYALSRRR